MIIQIVQEYRSTGGGHLEGCTGGQGEGTHLEETRDAARDTSLSKAVLELSQGLICTI